MNKIFKVVWSKARNCYVVASEFAKSRTKSGRAVKAAAVAAALTLGVNGLAMAEDLDVDLDALPDIGTLEYGKGYGIAIGENSIGVYSTDIAIGKNAQAQGEKVEESDEISYYGLATALGYSAQATMTGATALGALSNASGWNSTAVGIGAEASGSDSISLGSYSKASGNNSVAVGVTAQATEESASALGNDAQATGSNSTALGVGSRASTNATAVGTSAKATGDESAALGNSANASGKNSVAVGVSAQAKQENASALGNSAKAVTEGSTALGSGSVAGDSNVGNEDSTAVGAAARATGNKSSALGNAANASGNNSVAVGVAAQATQVNASALGNYAQATGSNSTALGVSSQASTNATAVGTSAQATGSDSSALGNKANAAGTNSVALGVSAQATQANASALGNSAEAVTKGSTALGSGSVAGDSEEGNENATAVGASASATGDKSAALGNAANAAGDNSVAVGVSAQATEGNASALGNKAQAIGSNSTALGSGSVAEEDNATAVGFDARATGSNSVALGMAAQATAGNASALGNNAQATGDNSTALGVSSQANNNATAVGASAKATGSDSSALGNGANAEGTYSVAVGVAAQATQANASALGNNAQATGDNSTALGVGSRAHTDATAVGTGAQATGNESAALGNSANAEGDNSVAVGVAAQATEVNASALGNNAQATGLNSTAFGYNAHATAEDSIAQGTGAVASGSNTIALGASATASGTSSLAFGYGATAATANSVALGDSAMTGTVVGTSEYKLEQVVDKNGKTVKVSITFDNFAGSSPVGTVSIGSVGNERTITNVAAGQISESSTDAINGSQLYAVADGLYSKINSINDHKHTVNGNDGDAVSPTDDGQYNKEGNLLINKLVDEEGFATYDISLNNELDLGDEGSITFNENHYFNSEEIKMGDTVISDNRVKVGDTFNIDNSSKEITVGKNVNIDMGGNIIRNVDAGVEDTDVVNVSQLNEVKALAGKHTQVTVEGGTDAGEGTDGGGNVYAGDNLLLHVTNDDGQLTYDLKLNSTLTNIDNIEINKGITIGKGDKIITINEGDVNFGGNVITNVVTDGSIDSSVVNVDYLKQYVSAADHKHTVNGNDGDAVSPTDDGQYNKEGNLLINKLVDEEGFATYDISLNNELDLGDEGSITFNENHYFNSEEIKMGDTVISDNRVKVGDTFNIDNSSKEITVGKNVNIDMGGNIIHNAGTTDGDNIYDVVNVDYLKQYVTNAVGEGDTDTHIKEGVYNIEKVELDGSISQDVTMDIVDKDGDTVGTVTIKDVAKASDIGDIGDFNDTVLNSDDTTTTVVDAINNIDNRVTTIEGDITNIKTDISNLDGRVTNIEGDITNIQTDISNLDGRVTTIEGDITNIQNEMQDIAEEAGRHTEVTVNGGDAAPTDGSYTSGNLQLKVTEGENGQDVYDVKLNNNLDLGADGSIKFGDSNTYIDGDSVTVGNTIIEDNRITVGDKVSITDSSVNIGDTSITENSVKFDDSHYFTNTEMKMGDTVITDNSVKVGGTINIDNSSKEIAVGADVNIDMGGNQVHNVAAGTADTDAVNVSQLKGVEQNVANNAVQINKLKGRIDRVGAGAAALAALHPLDFDPDDKFYLSAGYGHYRGENAVAVGAFYQPNDDTLFSISSTVGNDDDMINAGVTWRFGQSSHQSRSKKAMAKEIIELRTEVAELKAMVYSLTGHGLDLEKSKLFPDTPENHWAYDYVAVVAGNGILEGYPDGYFDGGRPMTRYEMAAVVYRLLQKGVQVDNRMVQEFAPELARVRVDTLTHHGDGTPHIQRVRVIKERG